MKSITVRVEDDFHHEVKVFALTQKKTLQNLIIELLKKEIEAHKKVELENM